MRYQGVTANLAGTGMDWARSAGECKRPTNRRQDKRAAVGLSYVVDVADEFAKPSAAPAGARPNFYNDFNAPSAIALPNPSGAKQRPLGMTICTSGPGAFDTGAVAPNKPRRLLAK